LRGVGIRLVSATTPRRRGSRRRPPRGADPLGLRAHRAGPPRQRDQPSARAVEAAHPEFCRRMGISASSPHSRGHGDPGRLSKRRSVRLLGWFSTGRRSRAPSRSRAARVAKERRPL